MTLAGRLLCLLSPRSASMANLMLDLDLFGPDGFHALEKLIDKLRNRYRVIVDDDGVRIDARDWPQAYKAALAESEKQAA